jgi:2-oxoisovalerate dehydrogenase E1 component
VDKVQSDLVDFYRKMLLIRLIEEQSRALSREGFMPGSIHLCVGQEAIPVGVASVLRPMDRVLSTYRGHGWALACGAPTTEVLGEICQRAGGLNGGRSGSPLLSAPEVGFLGENSIVGAGVSIACGVAMASQYLGTGGVAIVSIGDGAMNQGSVHEGLVFAATRNLPVVIICENNGWAEMTPTKLTTRGENAVDRAIGYHISSRIVDGCDPLEVADAANWALAEARENRGPVFLECKTVRLSGHYNGDIQHYRPKSDLESAASRDPLKLLRTRIIDSGMLPEDEVDLIDASVARSVETDTAIVRGMPEPDPQFASDHVSSFAKWNTPAADSDNRGNTVMMKYQKALNNALETELALRKELIVYGEDVGSAGGIFGVTMGLQNKFGENRVFDTPIAENAILGSALGASLQGLRPVVEIMWGDFLLVALDQLVNQAANVRYINRGKMTAPFVVRVQQGATPGSCAQHSQNLEAILAHIPGLRVGLPSTSADAYAMLRASIANDDPCVLFEARELYQLVGEVFPDAPVENVGGARLYNHGSDVAIITWGPMVHRSLTAAKNLGENGIGVSVLDLRWLNPIDDEKISEVVKLCEGRVLVVHEANITGGFGAEISARIQERHFELLKAPVRRLGAPDTRIPASPILQRSLIPDSRSIEEACMAIYNQTQVSR